MKFQLTLALAAVCVANAGRLQDKAESFANQQKNPISAQNQAKLERAAKQSIDQYTKLAQSEGKKYGIDFDLTAVYESLNKQYGKQVQSAVKGAAAKAQNLANNGESQLENNQNIKKAQKFAQSATFDGVLAQVQKALKQQVKNIPNKQVQKSLTSIVTQGAKEAKNQMRANGLNGNIQKKSQKFVAQNKGQFVNPRKIAGLKRQLNQKIGNL